MIEGFWKKLPKGFMVLAPMADVTDQAFRRVIAKYSRHGEVGGGPDVFWTEFVSADGLMSPGREVLRHDLAYTEGERPVIAQLFGSHIEKMEGAAKLCQELGFDGIDINMGCPDKSILGSPNYSQKIFLRLRYMLALAKKCPPCLLDGNTCAKS